MSECVWIYVTVEDGPEAETIARRLVEERLVACANLLAGMRSFYRWEGAVQSDREVVLVAKTRRDRFEAVRERVRALHSAEVPCIVALPIVAGEPDFLDWISREAASGG